MSDLPFQAEYAKSGRAGCKACSKSIEKESLRLAVMIQSRHFDGKVPNWFHFKCFWSRAKCTKTDDIHGFDNLRWEDQDKIRNEVNGKQSSKVSGIAGPDANYKDYLVEYAKSSRSTCRGCETKINKDLVRLSHKEFDSDRAKMYGPQDAWYHIDCFISKRTELGFSEEMDSTKIPGFSTLRSENQEDLAKKMGKGKRKKRKAETELCCDTTKKPKDELQEEIDLRAQSEMIWKIRDTLRGSVSIEALKGLLQYNDQEVPSGESRLLDCVSDAMVFGALLSCPECYGQLRLSGSTSGYQCTGNVTGWTKCQYVTLEPKRKAFKVPVEYHDVTFLKKYKYIERERIFPKKDEQASNMIDIKMKTKKFLTNIRIGFLGKLSIKQSDAATIIKEYGGAVSNKKDDPKLTLVISTKAEFDKAKLKTNHYEALQIPVVSEQFLDNLKTIGDEDLVSVIGNHQLSDWYSDVGAKINELNLPKKKSESLFAKNDQSKVKVSVKGGAAVDPDSGLEDKAHVLQGENKNELFNVVLGLVDISKGTNSFYKLQVLEADKGSKWWIFRAWGRVGTTIGGNKLENFSSKISAIEDFKALYEEKTGNSWHNRSHFIKVPNKFYPLDIDYGVEEAHIKDLNSSGSKSKLPKQVQELIKLMFDIENMKRAMLEFEIDLKKMPLGKLSKKQIENAYKILAELQKLVDSKETSTLILDASNRFYTLIPHDFGLKKPPLLDTNTIIKNKIEMLDSLLEIEIAYSLLSAEKNEDSELDILDAHYNNLNADLKVLDKNSDEYKRISLYVQNTHGATHTQYDLEIEDIFVLNRHGESKVYKPFKDLHNRMLLWHGSRITNFVGIISQGLRIAPPEAPVTGYMFGKGIYFADMVSKSANYCMTSKKNPTGLMLLSEVALGNMLELTTSEYVEKLPKGKHSVKGLGATAPDPTSNFVCDDGVVIPVGKGIKTNIKKADLLYNEYIVYDVAQVNLKYLLKMNFKYR